MIKKSMADSDQSKTQSSAVSSDDNDDFRLLCMPIQQLQSIGMVKMPLIPVDIFLGKGFAPIHVVAFINIGAA